MIIIEEWQFDGFKEIHKYEGLTLYANDINKLFKNIDGLTDLKSLTYRPATDDEIKLLEKSEDGYLKIGDINWKT